MAFFLRELGMVTRRLFRNPIFTIITIATLAIGIGTNTAIFSLVNGILLKPLPFDTPHERLAHGSRFGLRRYQPIARAPLHLSG